MRRPVAAATRTSGAEPERKRIRNPQRARAQILESARRIFNRDSYFATNSNTIARQAGYAPGTFYTHFADKRAVFLAVYEAWVADEWRVVNTAMQGRSGKAGFRAAITMVVAHHRETSVMRRSLRALAAVEPTVRDAQNAQRIRQVSWLQDLCAAQGWSRPSEAICVMVLLATERVTDAVAEGDVHRLGADEQTVCHELSRWILTLIAPGPKGSGAVKSRGRTT